MSPSNSMGRPSLFVKSLISDRENKGMEAGEGPQALIDSFFALG